MSTKIDISMVIIAEARHRPVVKPFAAFRITDRE
jgi:hypothetical protein